MKTDGRMKHLISYLFFGVCTTLVNIVSYGFLSRMGNLGTVPATAAAWVLAVLFAFVTNKRFVFDSRSFRWEILRREVPAFFGCRLLTGLFDLGWMWVTVEAWHLPDLWMKIFSNFLVILLNYLASRWIIFRKKEDA